MSKWKLVQGRKRSAALRKRDSKGKRGAPRRLRCEPLENRLLLADLQVRFEYSDNLGNEITSADVGDRIVMDVFVQDTRNSPTGVSRAYFDFTYDSSIAIARDPVGHGAFALSPSGSVATAGLIDEVGGLDTDAAPPGNPSGELLLFSVPFDALATGTLSLTPNAADGPTRNVQFYFDQTPVALSQIDFVNGSFDIAGAGINVTPTTGLTTTELGGTDDFAVVLSSQPTSNVTINLSSSDTTEGTVSPASVTFTTANWNTPRTVTVTGVNDSVDDGTVGYAIVTAPAISSDAAFNGFDPSNVSVTNTDDGDTAGINVTASTPLMTSETGTTATFQLVLNSQPTGNVTIPISSSDPTEGTVSVSSVVFTPQNWNVNRAVTVTGVDDPVADGDRSYSILVGAASSSDSKYNGMDPADLAATNSDAGDVAGFFIQPTAELLTSEAGATATFQIRLISQPATNVAIGLSSSDMTEGTVLPASVTFTPTNWNTLQTVTIMGVNDDVADGAVAYSIVTAPATGDAAYAGMNPADVSVTNLNDGDTAGFIIAPTSGLTTTEAGGTAQFTVRLRSEPTANVQVTLSSSDTSEGTVAPSVLTFTPGNWDSLQTATVTGVNDAIRDGNIGYTIVTSASSADSQYANIEPPDVSVTNSDDEPAEIIVSPTSGLATSEAGVADTLTIVLNGPPTANVTINLSSSDPTEGTVSPTSVTFTTSNWNAPRTVTVTGVNDEVDDGNVSYTIVTAPAISSDAEFNGLNPTDVTVTNLDDADTAGITVTAVTPLTTSEPVTPGTLGTTATFQIVLDSQPTSNVTIPISSSDTTEGTVSVSSVVFTPQNWNAPRTVTVTGVDDSVADGDVTYSIILGNASSSDSKYSVLNPDDLAAINQGGTPGFIIQPTSGLMTTEAGGAATFRIRLNSQPATNVMIGLSSSDETEGTVSSSSVTFTPANWNVLQTVTVTGVDDDDADGTASYSIITATATGDAAFAGVNPVDVSVSNLDDDPIGFSITPTSGLVTAETGQTATFNIRLTSRPTANVTLPLSISDPSEATVAPANVTFTPQNWNVNQTITVTGVNDDVDDGTVAYEVITGAATSSDGAYSGLDPANVLASNNDDLDTASVVVDPTAGLTTTEAGGTDSFSVRLGSQPTANVQVQLSSSDGSEGTVSPAILTFTTANWNVDQNVTVTGVDDDVHDGNVGYTILTSVTGADATYNPLNPDDVSVLNTDDDPVGVIFDPDAGLTTTESGGTAQFTVRLQSKPTGNVTIPFSSSDATEGTVAPASLTFTDQNWDVPQVVTVTGLSDFRADGDIDFQVVTGPAVSGDADYSGFNAADAAVTNIDIGPAAGFNITRTSGLVVAEEGPTSTTFQVSLTSQPAADVMFNLMSGDTTEGTVSPASLIFNEQNWNVPQTVTVVGVDDLQSDGDVLFTIQTSVTSQDPVYAGLDPTDVSVTNINDDPLAITVSPTTGLQTDESGTSASFALALTSQPTADVTIGVASSMPSEGTVSTTSVTFTVGNWDTPQNVTVVGVDDETVDGDRSFMITTAAAISADPDYNGFDPPDVSVSNRDDDSATLTLSTMSATQAEGTDTGLTDFVFQLELSRAVAGGFDVGYTTNDGTATAADGDYVDNDGLLSFEGAKCEIKTITVQATQDNKVELDEMFDVSVGELTDIAANLAERITLTTARVTATIANDDAAALLLSPISTVLQEGAGAGTTELTFAVTLSAPVQGGLNINYSVADGSATLADDDYVDNDGTLSFTGTAEERRTITVAVNGDSRVEANETFVVALQGLSGIDPILADSIDVDSSPETATILNDDTATLTLSNATASQPEGSDGLTTDYTFDVTLSNAVQGGFGVAYTTDDGTATLADGDYLDNDGVLTFLGTADEVQSVTVRVNQDLQIEPNETFQVGLGELSGTSLTIAESVSIGGSPATATILNDDVPRLVVTLDDPASNEGTSGDGSVFTFTVTLSDDIDDPDGFEVAFATSDGTATAASGDYTANSGMLHFAGTAGESQTINVAGLPDTIVEANETFQFVLGDVTGLAPGITVLKTGTPATATIQNDDVTTVAISPLTASADEGTGASGAEFTFEVKLSNPVQGGFRVDYTTADGTATVADADYVANTNTLAFNGDANETQSVTVAVSPDAKVEADEVLQLMLQALDVTDAQVASSITLGDPASVSIINDDTAELTLTPITAMQDEGTGGTTTESTFEVTLSNQIQGGFEIVYNTNDGSATLADADYVDNDGVLKFDGNANETQTITVQVNHDQQIEPNESFNVSLGAISQLDPTAVDDIAVIGSPANATIRNDDFPRLVVSAEVASQVEGNGGGTTAFVFTVTLSDLVADADGFDVAYATTDGTASSAGGDYVDNDGVLHFSGTAGESQTVVVNVNHDEIVEADETFAFSLREISDLVDGEMVVFDGSPLTATILNDDAATLSLTAGTVSQNEGSDGATEFTFDVALSNAVQGGFSVSYRTVDGSATVADVDYVDNDGTLRFAGNTGETQTITVQVNPDNRVELDETFQVALGILGDVENAIAASMTIDDLPETATILNDDTTTVTVSAVAATVTEGTGSGTSEIAFEVTLSNPVQGGFRIGYAANDDTATAADADYVDNDGSLLFSGTLNETQTVVVQVGRDSLVERNESFAFGLTQLTEIDPTLAQSVSVNGTPSEATIVNDDSATVSFVTAASNVAEANGTHTVEVILNVNNSGSLSDDIVVNIAALPTSTAVTPADFLLDTTSVTFTAGSQDGARRTVSLTLVVDELTEQQETIDLQLSLNGQDIGGAVTTGAADHVVTVADDPMTGAISGIVWADTNNNGNVDDNEMMIPGVTVRLAGQDFRGQTVEIETMTAADGSYVFDRLPGGTYRVTQVQPAAFHDGLEVLGTVEGIASGQVAADEFLGIVLEPTQTASGYNFAEASLQARYVTNRLFLASTTSQRATMLRGFVADGEARTGNETQAAAIRTGEVVEVRRIGSQLTVIGTSKRDVVTFTPTVASSGDEHTIEANGLRWTFNPADVNDFKFIGAGGDDILRIDDSAADEKLTATRDTAFVTTQDYRAEATAFELIQAISDSGGQDEAMSIEQAVDFLWRLEGNWEIQ